MAVGRNYRTPPATILTYSSRLVHIHTSNHTRTPVASTTLLLQFFTSYSSEAEKNRRWIEIKERQQILMKEAVEAQMPAHIDQIMRSGFTISDIKGM